jgi:GAF domain-containing protein/nitrogen-specific signal transduction histidine kinase
MSAGLAIGLGLVIISLILVIPVLVLVAMRRLPQGLSSSAEPATRHELPDNLHPDEAILIIQAGGRVEYVNGLARQWFGLRPDEPADLELLVRRARPAEELLNLFAAPGQKRLSISGRLVEAVSYQIPGPYPVMFAILRNAELASDLEGTGLQSSVLQIVSDFGKNISASLNLEDTLHAILLNVSQIAPADMIEVKVCEDSAETLTTYTLETTGSSLLNKPSHSQFNGLSQKVFASRQPLLIPDTAKLAQPDLHAGSPVQSYLGLPLLVGDQLVGMVEIGHSTAGALGQHDLDLLELVSPQAAYSIRNAILYAREQSRAAELGGLANLTQTFGPTDNYQDVIQRLIETISTLFSVEVIGFLMYDEESHTLQGQIPFQGLPEHIVAIYRTAVGADGAADGLLRRAEPIITRNAADDPFWRELGLKDFVQAASLRESVLMPMESNGNLVGYLQLSNHRAAAFPFSDSEISLIKAVADRATGIIENSFIVEKSRRQAVRSDALRRIAGLVVSTTPLDEILCLCMKEIADLFQSDLGAIFLLDEKLGELRLHRESVRGVGRESIEQLAHLHVDGTQYRYTVSGSQKPYLSGRLSSDRRILPVYRPLVSVLQVESAIVVPLVAHDRSLGELMLGSQKTEFFNAYDLDVVATAGAQIATAIEAAAQSTQTDEGLRRNVEQLTSIVRISRELGSMMDLKTLVDLILDEAMRTTRAACGTVQLFNANDSSLAAATSSSKECSLPQMSSPLERQVLTSGKGRLISDYSQEALAPGHEGVQSAILAPIIDREKSVGLIEVHSLQAGFFDQADLDGLQTLASHTAAALESIQRNQEHLQRTELLRRRSETLTRVTDVSYGLHFDQPLDQLLRTIADSIREATPFQAVLISIYEPDTGLLRRVTGIGFPPETLAELMARKQPLSSIQQMLKPQFKISRSYFIPVDDAPIIPADVHMVSVEQPSGSASSSTWDPDDFLIVPLEDSQGAPLGLLSVDAPRDGLRPDRATIEALEIFAAQISLAVSNSSRFSELRTRADTLTASLERQQRLISLTQNDLPILLRKDLDQTIAIQNLDQRTQRVRAGLAITESVSRQLDASSALLALGRETLTQLRMSVAMVAEMTSEGPRLIHVLGNIPRATSPEALFGQRNPLRASLQTGETILVANLDENLDWRETPLLSAMRAKSLICLPIKIDKKAIAAMMAVSPEPLPEFTAEDLQVYHQVARQTSVILQNISLLNETRRRLQEVNLLLDFSRQLRGLDPEQIVRALLESARRALPAAHAGMVLIWDEHAGQLLPRAVSGYADNETMHRIEFRLGESLPGRVYESKRPLRVDEVQFTRDYSFSTEGLLLYRQATGGRLPVSSLLIPIQAGDYTVGVLLLDNFNTPVAFSAEDETLLLSLSQQVGLSMQNVRLMQTTQERAAQLEALTDAATTLTANLQSEELVASLLDQLEPVIPYDTATLWLREKDRLIVAAARGFPDMERRLGLAIAMEDSALFNEMIRTGQGILVGDVRHDPRFPPLEAPRLSWLGLPLISKRQVLGVLALEKWQPHFYSRVHMQVGTTFASQAAVALENARLFEESLSRASELDERSQRLGLLNRFSSALGGLLDEGKILQLTAQELQDALNAPEISIVVFERGNPVWKYSLPRRNQELPKRLPEAPIFSRLQESLGVFTTDSVDAEPDLMSLQDFLGEKTKALLILPLVSGANLSALIFVHQTERIRFRLTEIELARTFTNQASIALENARLYQSTLFTAERFSILNQATYQVGANLDPEQVYIAVHQAAKRLMPVEAFVISLLDEETAEIEGVYLVDEDKRAPITRIPRDQGLSGRVIATGEPLILHGAQIVDDMGGVNYGKSDTPLSILAVPMTLSGKTVGMLSAQTYKPNVYTEDDLQILSTLANQAAVAIQNGRLFNETERLARELERRVVERTAQLQREQQNTETLLRILTEVSSSLDLDRALNRTLALLNDAIGAEQGTIMLLNLEDNLLHFRAGYGYLSESISGGGRGFKLGIGEGLAGWVVARREPALVDDLLTDPRWVKAADSSREHRSAIAMPLLVAEDVIGALLVYHRKPNYFSAELLGLVKAIAGQVAVAINNAHLYELIRDQAERLGGMLRREQEDASRSQAILEAVADGVLVTGSNNRITFINPSAGSILNLEAERVLGQPLEVFGGLFGKSTGTWIQTIRDWSDSPGNYQQGDTYAEQIDLENGRIILVHLAPVIFQNDFLGTVSIFRDITHEVEVDRLKSEFVATVSHELRTPMTSIRGYTDVLLMGAAGALNENQAHFLHIVKNNTERLNILVNDLLDVSRIESGRVTLSPQALDMREVAEDVISDVLRRSQEENKPMALSLDAPKKLPRVYGDMERIRQVLGNLMDNAYHYTPENGTIAIRMQALNGGDEVQVDVNDNGVGISMDDQDRIFERFYRGENPLVLSTPGTGLGLSIVKQIIEMHKGRIWMKSTGVPGEGSTFSFTLPVYETQ